MLLICVKTQLLQALFQRLNFLSHALGYLQIVGHECGVLEIALLELSELAYFVLTNGQFSGKMFVSHL